MCWCEHIHLSKYLVVGNKLLEVFLGCFQFIVCWFFGLCVAFIKSMCLILGAISDYTFSFILNFKLFWCDLSCYIPTGNEYNSLFLWPYSHVTLFHWLLNFYRYTMLYCSYFYLHFSNDKNILFHFLNCHLCIFFLEDSVEIFQITLIESFIFWF